MRRLFPALLAACALASAGPLAADDKPFFFQPKDRVLFLGDSITEQYQYSNDIELYLTLRYPKAGFVFLNAGIGGDTANGGAGRFQSHVLDEKPTAVTINFGMNDGGYKGFNEGGNKTYRDKTAAMLKAAADAKVRVALVSPNAVDVRTNPGLKEYLETQQKFYAPLKEIADKAGVPFADQYAVTRAAMAKMTADDAKAKAVNPFPDGVHTSGAGGLFMAHAILTQLHAPATVSKVAVEGGKAATENCTVSDLTATDAGVTFTRTDEATPLPVQKDWAGVLPYVNDLKDLNVYGLTVSGLKDGSYDVLCDGVKVGTFAAKDLAAGVNLGNATAGPLYDQGNKVLAAVTKKNEMVHQRFRGVVMSNTVLPDWVSKELRDAVQKERAAELGKRMAKIEEAQKAVWELAQPKPHQWEVKAAK